MAAWQFDLTFYRVPRGVNLDAGLLAEAEESLANTGLARWTMLEGWTVFGDEKGNRFDLNVDDESFELHARLDARSSTTDEFVGHVCALATALNCQLLCSELNETLEPKARTVKQALQRSSAWRYALDPTTFLSG